MIKRFSTCLALLAVTFAIANAEIPAEKLVLGPPVRVQIPGTQYEFTFGSVQFARTRTRAEGALLTALIFWISENSSLPAHYDLPEVQLTSATQLAASLSEDPATATMRPAPVFDLAAHREIVSVYHAPNKTIYVRDDWTTNTPMELSILVHEIVHYLQDRTGLKYECPEDREWLAYTVQGKWLDLFGSELISDLHPFAASPHQSRAQRAVQRKLVDAGSVPSSVSCSSAP